MPLNEIERQSGKSAGRVLISNCHCDYSINASAAGNYVERVVDFGNRVQLQVRCMACKGDRTITYHAPTEVTDYPAVVCLSCYNVTQKKDTEVVAEELKSMGENTLYVRYYKCVHCSKLIPELQFPSEEEVFNDN